MQYHRIKREKDFIYTDKKDNIVDDRQLKAWFKSLAIPPVWERVEINSPRAKIWATGFDIKGRKQYIYNSKFRQKQAEQKFDRIVRFADQLEPMRALTGQHLRKRKLPREKVLAAMVRLLESACFRPGNEVYTKENESYGLTTLRSKHLSIEGDELIFSYKGKSGVQQEKHVIDAHLAKIVKELDDISGYEIFKYIDDQDHVQNITTNDLNDYIHEIMGGEFSAKDFRTWAGTVMAAVSLDEIGIVEEDDQKNLKKNIHEAIIAVSRKLGNTPAIARDAYIDPRIIDNYIHGRTLSFFKKEVNKLLKINKKLSAAELGVVCLLKKQFNEKAKKKC
ncbi:DNA topoisomerase IB [Arachidicoccus sp.]|uniref:DNA topoisomerase IB n=1 Tax=Arachidicoccus sp. TaxID=1872624 RepID=UPI003D25C024